MVFFGCFIASFRFILVFSLVFSLFLSFIIVNRHWRNLGKSRDDREDFL